MPIALGSGEVVLRAVDRHPAGGKAAAVRPEHRPRRNGQDERVDGRRAEGQVRMEAAAVRARARAEVGGRRRDRQAIVRERVLDREVQRERIAGLRVEHVLEHDPALLALADPSSPPSGRGRGSRSAPRARRAPAGVASRRTRRRRPRSGSATGSAPARARTRSARPRGRRRAARGHPRSRPAARRRLRRRPRAGRHGRSRTAPRRERTRLARHRADGGARRPPAGDDEGPGSHGPDRLRCLCADAQAASPPWTAAVTGASAPSRSSRWSPTRSEFAIAVSAGLTAPMLGKMLVSTT